MIRIQLFIITLLLVGSVRGQDKSDSFAFMPGVKHDTVTVQVPVYLLPLYDTIPCTITYRGPLKQLLWEDGWYISNTLVTQRGTPVHEPVLVGYLTNNKKDRFKYPVVSVILDTARVKRKQ